MYGWRGKVLRVDLTSGKIKEEKLERGTSFLNGLTCVMPDALKKLKKRPPCFILRSENN